MNEQEQGGDAYAFKNIHVHGSGEACHHTCPAYAPMLAEKTAARLGCAQMQNERGEWVPAIPEPLFLPLGWTRCECGETWFGRRRFREHYALAHVLAVA